MEDFDARIARWEANVFNSERYPDEEEELGEKEQNEGYCSTD
jgi:hypothetical protein